MSAANPYAPPSAHVADSVDVQTAVAIRHEHITHETTVRAVGLLSILGGLLVLGRGLWIAMFAVHMPLHLLVFYKLVFPLLLFVGALSVAGGIGLLRLSPWARVLALVLCCVGLLLAVRSATFGFRVAPFGALISACVIYVLLTVKSRRLFASDYAAIAAATPHVEYRTSILLWVLLALVLSVIGVLIVAGP